MSFTVTPENTISMDSLFSKFESFLSNIFFFSVRGACAVNVITRLAMYCTYNVTVRRLLATTVAVEKQ